MTAIQSRSPDIPHSLDSSLTRTYDLSHDSESTRRTIQDGESQSHVLDRRSGSENKRRSSVEDRIEHQTVGFAEKVSHKLEALASESDTTSILERPEGPSTPESPQPNGHMIRARDQVMAASDGYKRLGDYQTVEFQEVLKLSPERLRELTHSPDSLPLRPASPSPKALNLDGQTVTKSSTMDRSPQEPHHKQIQLGSPLPLADYDPEQRKTRNLTIDTKARSPSDPHSTSSRPGKPQRALSTPASSRSILSPRKADADSLHLDQPRLKSAMSSSRPLPSPMPKSIPLPPLSIPTYLQLELSSHRPSQLYIHRSTNSEFPYESSRAKIERLLNFLLLPFHLEAVLWFGTLACLDAWLYTFTILPLRLLKSVYILGQSWSTNVAKEIQFVSSFIYRGSGRMWQRRHSKSSSVRRISGSDASDSRTTGAHLRYPGSRFIKHHRRSKSVPSMLLPDDKADILKGLLIICTTLVLLRFDASKMYHWVRGQAAIKLYVIYNILEVCDRLFSAIGQDVLECLFSREALERKPDGHSKILRPFWLFTLALAYTIIHSTALFYQVITLNVAVNSYSNALIALLLSNQFAEMKGTVFKKFEKENLFQLTCADVVERFQLWHMLVIIASRNIVATGFLSQPFSVLGSASSTLAAARATNTSIPITAAVPPRTASSILPLSFTLVPEIVNSITSYVPTIGHVMGPFLIVLGSEMLVDWLKHAYINKFNNTRPEIYDRFLDVLAKDYYTNAFGDQNLTKRLGLPVIPLSCLLIRAGVQTYHMFVEVWVPSTPASSSTSLTSIHQQYSSSLKPTPTSTAASIYRNVDEWLGGLPSTLVNSNLPSQMTTVLVLLLIFFVLLACKLVLGMLLLSFSRARYRTMKEREKNPIQHVEGGRRIGGWGVVEVDQDKRRWIYEDDPDGLRALQEREEREKAKRDRDKEKGVGVDSFDKVQRYEMVAKRIW